MDKGITLEMTTTQEQKRNQQSIATSRKASEISSGDPMMILFSLLESLISTSLFLLKVKANFPFTFLLLISSCSHILTHLISLYVSSYSSESVQMRNVEKLMLSLPLGFNKDRDYASFPT